MVLRRLRGEDPTVRTVRHPVQKPKVDEPPESGFAYVGDFRVVSLVERPDEHCREQERGSREAMKIVPRADLPGEQRDLLAALGQYLHAIATLLPRVSEYVKEGPAATVLYALF